MKCIATWNISVSESGRLYADANLKHEWTRQIDAGNALVAESMVGTTSVLPDKRLCNHPFTHTGLLRDAS